MEIFGVEVHRKFYVVEFPGCVFSFCHLALASVKISIDLHAFYGSLKLEL